MTPETIATATPFLSLIADSAKYWIFGNLPAFFDWALKYILLPVGLYLVNLLNSRIINGNIESVLSTTKEIIRATVSRTNQREVDLIKSSGVKLTSEQVADFQKRTLQDVKAQLNDFSKQILAVRFPNLDLTLENMIEDEVRNQKQPSDVK